MMRFLNILVAASLIFGAVFVYRVKYEATRQAEEVARLRLDINRERDAIAELRAQWARLNRPDRIQELAERHLSLKPLALEQMHSLDNLPEKIVVDPDPIGRMLDAMATDETGLTTGTVRAPLPQRRPIQGVR